MNDTTSKQSVEVGSVWRIRRTGTILQVKEELSPNEWLCACTCCDRSAPHDRSWLDDATCLYSPSDGEPVVLGTMVVNHDETWFQVKDGNGVPIGEIVNLGLFKGSRRYRLIAIPVKGVE